MRGMAGPAGPSRLVRNGERQASPGVARSVKKGKAWPASPVSAGL